MYGFLNKKDLAKWNKEDMQKAKECIWLIDSKVECPKGKLSRIKYITDWHRKLCDCLPSPELNVLNEKLKKLSIFANIDRFESAVILARYDMVQKILAYQYQKVEMIEQSAKNQDVEVRSTFMEEYNTANLTKPLPFGSTSWVERQNKHLAGYTPCYLRLKLLPPMEILEYVEHKLIKYDKYYGYFSAVIIFPDSWRREEKTIYGKDANEVELEAEKVFKESIVYYMKLNENPYGNR